MKPKHHPALDTVPWKWDGRHCEYAFYRGFNLKIRHIKNGKMWNDQFCIGYIEDTIIGHAENVPKICEKLFRMVDRLRERDGRASSKT